ncbi:hypothetical protein KPL47_19210 [Clostridium estertheticum]|uniref:YkvI family membrane protein n=1 Tax=Clostridium estertheticum TaxID=238834 RepID=UPI001C0B4458|nr:hypothetical protein [Clostridium estertheticum]MBU3178455.1 hypothetical protein [Clostridium estertheticum]
MEKQLTSVKKVVLLAGALCAYWIGSGFATGQEVLQFFATSGTKGIIAALIFVALMIPLTYILYGIGQKKKFDNPYDVFEYYCGKALGKVYVWYSVVLVYAISVVMLAGGGATIHQYYGIPTYIGTGAIALLALGTILLGVEKFIDIIGVIGPIKILFVAIIGICGIITIFGQPTILSEAGRLMPTLGFKSASSNWAWSGALYAFLALMVSIPFQVSCGASAGSLKEARTAAVVGTVAFTIAIIALIIGELVYYKLIIGTQVPTLAIANHISPILGLIFSILIVLSIYSAVASFLLMVVRKFATDKTKKFNIIATVLTVISMLFGGVLPFDKLLNILYPLAGYSAIVFAGFMIYKELREKTKELKKNKVNHSI